MDNLEIRELARVKAVLAEPSENGLFDLDKRAKVFINTCWEHGLAVMLGSWDLLSDEEKEKYAIIWMLDM